MFLNNEGLFLCVQCEGDCGRTTIDARGWQVARVSEERYLMSKTLRVLKFVVIGAFRLSMILMPTVLDINFVLQVSAKWPTVVGIFVQQSSQWNSCR
jgi:hypothetical protein